MAFGWLGLLPCDFYKMQLDDFNLMVKGYFEKRKRDELNFANVGSIIDSFVAGVSNNKLWNYKKFIANWFGEKAPEMSLEEKKQRSLQMMQRVKLTNKILEEKEKVIPKKKKRGRATKNSN